MQQDLILWDTFTNCKIDNYKEFIKEHPTAPPERIVKVRKGYEKGIYIEKWLVAEENAQQCIDMRLNIYFNLELDKKVKLDFSRYLEFARQQKFHWHHVKPIRVEEYVIPPEK